jgi:hypothetical protein
MHLVEWRVAAGFPLVTVPLIILVGFLFHQSLKSEVTACFVRGCFDTSIAQQFVPTIIPFIAGTKFEGKLNMGEPPKDGSLNVYFATGQLPGRLSAIKCNCAYIGFGTVICDHQFLSSFEASVNFTRGSFYGPDAGRIWEEENGVFAQASERIAKVLVMWLIGHEIGHAVLHDDINFERRRAMTESQELQADGFFIEKAFAHADKRQRQDIYWGINQFIFSIYTMTFHAKPGNGFAVVTPSVDDVHPPWVIRALKLGERMTSLDPDSPRGNDFYESLSRHIEVRPGGTDIGSFCAAANLREIGARRQEERLKSHD